jgi:hypothetical protein
MDADARFLLVVRCMQTTFKFPQWHQFEEFCVLEDIVAGTQTDWWGVGSGREATAGYLEACEHQPMVPTVNDSVPGPMFSEKSVFTLCGKLQDSRWLQNTTHDDQAPRFALTTKHGSLRSSSQIRADYCKNHDRQAPRFALTTKHGSWRSSCQIRADF